MNVPALRQAHAIWILRRAALLDGISADASEAPAPARASVFYRIADKVTRAVDAGAAVALTDDERSALLSDAGALSERATAELRRPPPRRLERTEEWLRIALALREVASAARGLTFAPDGDDREGVGVSRAAPG